MAVVGVCERCSLTFYPPLKKLLCGLSRVGLSSALDGGKPSGYSALLKAKEKDKGLDFTPMLLPKCSDLISAVKWKRSHHDN